VWYDLSLSVVLLDDSLF